MTEQLNEVGGTLPIPMAQVLDPGRVVRADLVAAVLSVLSTATEPTGASVIHEQLLGWGFRLSEPTVGRMLREFDRLGYTTRHGRLGRTLTKKGRAELEQLQDRRSRTQRASEIVDLMRADKLESVMNILAARRGVEREIARAAALSATAKDTARLRKLYGAIRKGEATAGLHDILAQSAHNPVLESVYRMLTQDPEIARLLDRLTQARGQLVDIPFDRKLVDAISRRDPEAAEAAVVEHIDQTLGTVKEFWSAAARRKVGRTRASAT